MADDRFVQNRKKNRRSKDEPTRAFDAADADEAHADEPDADAENEASRDAHRAAVPSRQSNCFAATGGLADRRHRRDLPTAESASPARSCPDGLAARAARPTDVELDVELEGGLYDACVHRRLAYENEVSSTIRGRWRSRAYASQRPRKEKSAWRERPEKDLATHRRRRGRDRDSAASNGLQTSIRADVNSVCKFFFEKIEKFPSHRRNGQNSSFRDCCGLPP